MSPVQSAVGLSRFLATLPTLKSIKTEIGMNLQRGILTEEQAERFLAGLNTLLALF